MPENNQWTENWIEQINYFKDHHEVLPLENNCMDDYCFYVDVVEANKQ